MSKKRACATCEFWDQTVDGHPVGICRGDLPKTGSLKFVDLSSVADATYWAVTTPEDWCRHWELRSELPTVSRMLEILSLFRRVTIDGDDETTWRASRGGQAHYGATLEEAVTKLWIASGEPVR
jgi:hypothetical protein